MKSLGGDQVSTFTMSLEELSQILGGSLHECQSTSCCQKFLIICDTLAPGFAHLNILRSIFFDRKMVSQTNTPNVIIPIRPGGPNLVPVYEVNKVTNVTPVTRINQRKIEFRTMVTLQYA